MKKCICKDDLLYLANQPDAPEDILSVYDHFVESEREKEEEQNH